MADIIVAEPAFQSVSTASIVLGIPKSSVYLLIRSGALRAVEIAGALRVPASAIHEFIAAHDVAVAS